MPVLPILKKQNVNERSGQISGQEKEESTLFYNVKGNPEKQPALDWKKQLKAIYVASDPFFLAQSKSTIFFNRMIEVIIA